MSSRLTLLFVVFSLFASPIYAQTDPCSLSGDVEAWAGRYKTSDCPNGIKSSVMTMVTADNSAVGKEVSTEVSATTRWVNTGIMLISNQRITIQAQGQVNTNPSGGSAWLPPDGLQNNNCSNARCAGEGLPFMALIGRIGNNDPFLISLGGQFEIETEGELFLSVNDGEFSDNGGLIFEISMLPIIWITFVNNNCPVGIDCKRTYPNLYSEL